VPEPVEVKTDTDPTFHEFAGEWFAAKAPELAKNTRSSYRSMLSNDLLPVFAGHRLSQITVQEVDRYKHTTLE
jgi:Phage integrase, N-terminal SAM-like domain